VDAFCRSERVNDLAEEFLDLGRADMRLLALQRIDIMCIDREAGRLGDPAAQGWEPNRQDFGLGEGDGRHGASVQRHSAVVHGGGDLIGGVHLVLVAGIDVDAAEAAQGAFCVLQVVGEGRWPIAKVATMAGKAVEFVRHSRDLALPFGVGGKDGGRVPSVAGGRLTPRAYFLRHRDPPGW